jgi:hypothetical protein
MLEKLALLKMAFCKAPVFSKVSSDRLRGLCSVLALTVVLRDVDIHLPSAQWQDPLECGSSRLPPEHR